MKTSRGYENKERGSEDIVGMRGNLGRIQHEGKPDGNRELVRLGRDLA